MTSKLLPYKNGSKSAKALAIALDVKQLKQEGSKWKPKNGDLVINWGSSNATHLCFTNPNTKVLNQPTSIKRASNKLQAFQDLEGNVPIPKFTTSREEASKWLGEGLVVCRTVLNGHSGQGIVIAEEQDQLVDAPLYTTYIKKKEEYRLHVMNGEVFFVQRKARKKEVPDDQVNWKVRNHQNGFIYSHIDVEATEAWKEIAIKAVNALGLDFGAVDLIVTSKKEAYVLEINTACGLEGLTLEKYVENFNKYL